jgi:hypothetical protein
MAWQHPGSGLCGFDHAPVGSGCQSRMAGLPFRREDRLRFHRLGRHSARLAERSFRHLAITRGISPCRNSKY